MTEIYFDSSATTKPCKAAVNAALQVIEENYGNPSARHKNGLMANRLLRESRETVAKALGVIPETVVFTSGGTMADNLAFFGAPNMRNGKRIITTRVEHHAVLHPAAELERRGFEVIYLDVDKNGQIDLNEFESAVNEETSFISIMHVNNETGAIFPIKELCAMAKRKNPKVIFHTDAVQSFGKCELLPAKWGIDLVSVSAHKIHGLKGAGALYVRKGINLKPLIFGGGQERDIVPGTENMPSIAAFAAACEELEKMKNNNITALSQKLKDGILKIPKTELNSPQNGLPNIINISFGKIPAEVMQSALSGEGIYVSSGSACTSSKAGKSHVLKAMGIAHPESAIRFSLSYMNTEDEVNEALEKIEKTAFMLGRTVGQ